MPREEVAANTRYMLLIQLPVSLCHFAVDPEQRRQMQITMNAFKDKPYFF